MTADHPKDVLQKWVQAFNQADVEALVRLYHEDAVNHQMALESVAGIKAIRQMFEQEFATTEMTCIIENLFEDGDWAIMEWRDPKGLRGCGFFQIRDGKISLQRGYWDRLSFQEQQNKPATE